MEYWLMLIELIGVAFGVTLVMQLIYKYLSGKNINSHRAELKELQKSVRATKDVNELKKVQDRMLELNSIIMKGTLKPMLVSTIVWFIIFSLIQPHFIGFAILKWDSPTLPLIGNDIGWFFGIVLMQMGFTPLIKKILKID